MHHMLSLATVAQGDFLALIERARAFSLDPFPRNTPLAGRSVGLEFRKTSTRTRTSFAVAAVRLGAHPIIFGPADLQTNTGETLEDTVAVLSRYLDVLVLRTAGDPAELQRMAQQNTLPIVNAMTADEHPTQALSDISMLTRRFDSLGGLRLLYSGDGNNTAVALAYAISRTRGMVGDFRTPRNYGLPEPALQVARALGERYGGEITHSHAPPSAGMDSGFDVVYTTRWQTTGTTKSDPQWRERFAPYAVHEELLTKVSRRGRRAVFMHDLPAVRGDECDAGVLDGADSICMDQAGHKLFTAMAVLEWCAKP